MTIWMRSRAWVAMMTVLIAAPVVAFAQDAAVLKDLTAVIALNAQPCGEVVSAVRQGQNDYLATCKDGNSYRVFTSPQGRVMVEKK